MTIFTRTLLLLPLLYLSNLFTTHSEIQSPSITQPRTFNTRVPHPRILPYDPSPLPYLFPHLRPEAIGGQPFYLISRPGERMNYSLQEPLPRTRGHLRNEGVNVWVRPSFN